MAQTRQILAFDIGASSGRAMLGLFQDGQLTLRELHRFANEPVELTGRLCWDLPRLVLEMKTALSKAAREGLEPDAIGIDTWGVDYGLLDKAGHVMGNPTHYRDSRTEKIMEAAFEKVGKEEIFDRTGLAFWPFNTLYQLYSEVREEDPLLAHARKFLLMPDLLAYILTGTLGCERTIASTTQLVDIHTGDWDWTLIKQMGIPDRIFLPITEPGQIRGMLDARIARETGVGVIPVVAVGGHDTASAVAAAPAKDKNFAYISSGTWSLIGVENESPVLTKEVLDGGLTNEGGVDGSYRVLQNVMGMWLIQECRREWEKMGRSLSWDAIVEAAKDAPPFLALIDPNAPAFYTPGDMPRRIQEQCLRTGQAVPQTVGEIARVIYESLALKYRKSIDTLRAATGNPVSDLHIIGGGANNAMLARFTCDCLGIPVHCGPTEATAIGNILMQLKALGDLTSLDEARALVRASFPPTTLTPDPAARDAWDKAYARFQQLH